jgi:short-subunit dehydrogenase
MASPRPVALVTGAASGIGAAFARIFAAHGHDLVLVDRREPQLVAVADEIAGTARRRPHVLPIDLTHVAAAERIAEELAGHALEPAFVINCAGFGLVGHAAELDRKEQLAMIDLNVRALSDLSLGFIDSLARHRGGILNVASLASFMPGPGMAVYNATKAYVVSFTEALHHELKPLGIRVTVLCPGPMPTGFHARAGLEQNRLQEPMVKLIARAPAWVARHGFAGLMRGKRRVVPGLGNKVIALFAGTIPRGMMLDAHDSSMMASRVVIDATIDATVGGSPPDTRA